jgi:hypothetical protein
MSCFSFSGLELLSNFRLVGCISPIHGSNAEVSVQSHNQ